MVGDVVVRGLLGYRNHEMIEFQFLVKERGQQNLYLGLPEGRLRPVQGTALETPLENSP